MSIKIDLKIFLILLLFLFTSQIEIYIILMFFALIHELGHCLAGMVLGLKPQTIRIMPFGVRIEFKIPCEEYNKKILKGNSLAIKKCIIACARSINQFYSCYNCNVW